MKERITEILMRANIECDVRHVGGTAIPGMCSKPIVDVLVTVDSEDMEIAPHALAREFCCLGECGRPGRYFFSDGDTEDDAVYIHLTTAANQVARDQLEFKDILLACPDVREEYAALKQRLAEQYPYALVCSLTVTVSLAFITCTPVELWLCNHGPRWHAASKRGYSKC